MKGTGRSVIIALVAGLMGATGWTFWLVFLYVVLANFFFQVRARPFSAARVAE